MQIVNYPSPSHQFSEAGQLSAAISNEYCGYYGYNAQGERTYKLTGTITTDQFNAGEVGINTYLDDMVLYVNPYMVVTPRGYTKHYYNGSQRIAARLGDYWAASVADESDMIARAREVLEQTMNSSDIEEEHFEEKYVRSIDGEEFYLEPFTLYTHYMTCSYPEDILHEVLNGGARLADHIGGIDRGIFYYHPDHLGSSSWITDDRGQVVQYLHYMPFGELWENQQAFDYDERFKFTGKERDTETGYDYFGARYYASTLPMWLSVDPLADKYPNISPYAYCAWNPMKYIDPDGRDAYIFDDNGSYIRTEQQQGQHYGIVLKDSKIDCTFDFADPINDPLAIDNGIINNIIIPTNEQILSILNESGVFDSKNQGIFSKYSYTYRESNAGSILGNGNMDYVISGKYNGAEVSKYGNYLFLTNINGKYVAHNNYNFGNFLWGAGVSALGIPYFAAKIGSNLNNFFNDMISKWHFDSADDQLSIKLGFQWQKQLR